MVRSKSRAGMKARLDEWFEGYWARLRKPIKAPEATRSGPPEEITADVLTVLARAEQHKAPLGTLKGLSHQYRVVSVTEGGAGRVAVRRWDRDEIRVHFHPSLKVAVPHALLGVGLKLPKMEKRDRYEACSLNNQDFEQLTRNLSWMDGVRAKCLLAASIVENYG